MARFISINHLSFSFTDSPVDFRDISMVLSQQRYGLLGDNGIGKTTLFKLINQELPAEHGRIHCDGVICTMAQHADNQVADIASALDIRGKLEALARVNDGQCDAEDFDLIGDDWDIGARAEVLLSEFSLSQPLDAPFQSLSGGEKTKVRLIRVMLTKADFYLLDEPTNNLDVHSRRILNTWMMQSDAGFLIISHDRDLLSGVDAIVELTEKGVELYEIGRAHV